MSGATWVADCDRCGYAFNTGRHNGICPVCEFNMFDDVWPCERAEWEQWHCFEGDQPYPDAAQLDAWCAEANRRMNVEHGRQPSLFDLPDETSIA